MNRKNTKYDGSLEYSHDSNALKNSLASPYGGLFQASDIASTSVSETIPEVLTTSELADRLKVSERTVFNMRKWEQIPFFKIGKSVRFIFSDVVEALKSK